MSILNDILKNKADEVIARKRRRSEPSLRDEAETLGAGNFALSSALQGSAGRFGAAIIAEIKRASPSKGLIRESFDVEAIAKSYSRGRAAALSVLTDQVFFSGQDDFLPLARQASGLPCLRKDFVIDPYQVFETRVLGADGLLLIVAALSPVLLRELFDLGKACGLDVLIEVHNEDELEQALSLKPALVGINNRNLHTFETRLEVTEELVKKIPPDVLVVSESGIHSRQDIVRLQSAGVRAFLVGESLMRAAHPEVALTGLLGLS